MPISVDHVASIVTLDSFDDFLHTEYHGYPWYCAGPVWHREKVVSLMYERARLKILLTNLWPQQAANTVEKTDKFRE